MVSLICNSVDRISSFDNSVRIPGMKILSYSLRSNSCKGASTPSNVSRRLSRRTSI